MRLSAIRNGPKRIIYASSWLGLLQMVSRLDIRCAREDAGPQGVDCEILHWLERGTKHFLQRCRKLCLVDAI